VPIEFDSSKEPVYVVRYVGSFSDDQWCEHIDGFMRILGQKRPYAAVIDNSASKQAPNAAQRQAMSRWLRLNAVGLKTFCRGVAFVHASSFVRGALTAIHWVAPPPYPFSTFALTTEAMDWCRNLLSGDAARTTSST
jgi:hypothetical protein